LVDLLEEINSKGPSVEFLFFIEYFKQTRKQPQDYVHSMLSTNGYELLSIDVTDQRIGIASNGESELFVDIKLSLIMLNLQRREVLNLHKTIKDIRKYIKQIKRELTRQCQALAWISIP